MAAGLQLQELQANLLAAKSSGSGSIINLNAFRDGESRVYVTVPTPILVQHLLVLAT